MPQAEPSAHRVPRHTAGEVNARIRQLMAHSIEQAERLGDDYIDRRLAELAREWDIERAIEANAASFSLAGLALAALTRRAAYLALPVVVGAFLLQHAVQGWCPPVPVLRRLLFRTAYEIEEERTALKALRGDFRQVASAEEALQAAVH